MARSSPSAALSEAAAVSPCCTAQRSGRTMPVPVPPSHGLDVLRASQVQHAVGRTDGNRRLRRPTPVRAGAQPVADHPLEPADVGLDQGAPVVARGGLLSHAVPCLDRLQAPVALRGCGLGDDGADQPFGLAQRQAEHRPERQRRGDCQARVAGLPTPRGPPLRLSGCDRLLGEPHPQAATLPQRRVAGRRVRCPVLLLRDVAAAVGVGLERHGGFLGQR